MTALPDGWTTRRPTLDDVPEILKMAHASDVAAVGEPDFTVDEVRESLTGPNTNMAEDCWVALDADGAIVGWAYPGNASGSDREFLEVYVWPERGIPALGTLLGLLVERSRHRARKFGHPVYTLRAGAIPAEKPWIAVLSAYGFRFLKQHARMQMSLVDAPATAPEPPPGVTIRAVDPDDEAEMRRFHAVIEEAFRDSDHHATGYDTWREQVEAESSRTYDEWFIASVDGEIAGALQSSDSGVDDDEGWVKNLAVLRAYRKRGLGEALLRRAFATYAAKGRAKAGLGVDMENPTAAARLYHAVGMHPLYLANIYQRTIEAAD
jgi:mycothiol synthase